jgi:hypothetical protein
LSRLSIRISLRTGLIEKSRALSGILQSSPPLAVTPEEIGSVDKLGNVAQELMLSTLPTFALF